MLSNDDAMDKIICKFFNAFRTYEELGLEPEKVESLCFGSGRLITHRTVPIGSSGGAGYPPRSQLL